MLLNVQGTFCPPHTPPAVQSRKLFHSFLTVSTRHFGGLFFFHKVTAKKFTDFSQRKPFPHFSAGENCDNMYKKNYALNSDCGPKGSPAQGELSP
jgi:hypothetical protein